MKCMKWSIEYIKEAARDLRKIEPCNRRLILKAIEKTAERPLPPPDGIGKPLGNHASSKLAGYYKIKLRDLGCRVVYGLKLENNVMRVIVIGIRDDDEVYKEAERRIRKLTEE